MIVKLFRKTESGVITVLVSLMLIGILSLGTLVIEAGRLQAAKTQIEEATASAGSSMIASFHGGLYERFGILSIDKERFTPARASDYLDFNSDSATGYEGNRLNRLYEIDGVELDGIYNLTSPSVLKRQLLIRAKYHAKIENSTINVNTVNAVFDDFKNKCNYISSALSPAANGGAGGAVEDVSEGMLAAIGQLYITYENYDKFDSDLDVTLTSSTLNALPSRTGTVSGNVPAGDVAAINSTVTRVQNLIGADASILGYTTAPTLSETDVVHIDLSALSGIKNQFRDVVGGNLSSSVVQKTVALANYYCSALDMLTSSDKDGNVLLNAYISEYFSDRCSTVTGASSPRKGSAVSGQNDMNFVSAAIEYVFGGSGSEASNQETAWEHILAIRFIYNLYAVLNDSSSFNPDSMYSVAAHMAWAYYESVTDMELLTDGKSVPLNNSRMILPVNNPDVVVAAFSSLDRMESLSALAYTPDSANAFSYIDMIDIALWFVPNSEKVMRCADLMQLEMRYREKYVDKTSPVFLMSEQNTYCRIFTKGKLNSALPVISLSSSGTLDGLEITSTKYVGY